MSEFIDEVFVEPSYTIRFGYDDFTLTAQAAEDLYRQLVVLLGKESR